MRDRRLLSGLRAWTVQRASALYLAGFGVVLAVRLVSEPPDSYRRWVALWSHPAMASAAMLAVACLCLHAWVGARDVILDYVRPAAVRPVALALLALFLVLVATRLAFALLRAAG